MDYLNLIKVAIAILLLVGWAAVVQWVDRDTDVVKTRREHWNMLCVVGGMAAYFVFLLPPWHGALFAVGVFAWMVLAGAPMLGYVIHRNGRVSPANKVLTPSHIKTLIGLSKEKKASVGKDLKVKINDHAGKFVDMGSTADEVKDFESVQDFLYDLLWRRASDADMVAGAEKYRLVYKVDGVATEHKDGIPAEKGQRIFRMLKRIAGLNVEEIRRPQSGKIQASLISDEKPTGVCEVHTSGTMAGERMRLQIKSSAVLMRLADLGLAAQRLESVNGFLRKQHGVLLITSPPQNGMTTTQYAIVKSHDAYINNIHALERNALLDLDNITQQKFEGDNTDVNYARALQTVLRREPDIVLVDCCEDRETAKIAARAGAEDRKIYMGMHAKDCFDALGRFISWVSDNAMSSKALLGVINQRLVRILCKDCREAYEPDPATLKKLNLPADKIDRFYRPPSEQKLDKRGKEVMCPTCRGTGYHGRTGVFEVLVTDEPIGKLIAEGASVEKIQAQCRKNKMYYLQEEALLKVIDGTTSMNEVLRCLRSNEKEKA